MLILTLAAVALRLAFSKALRSSGHGILDELQKPEMFAKRVAVVGAGAGGSSAAYHLSQNAKDAGLPVNITVFERSSYVGGRSTTVNAWSDPDVPIELGASIFVEVNHILVAAAEKFNLSAASNDRPRADGASELGIWNGIEWVLVTNAEDSWWEKGKILWKYGLAPIRTNYLMKSTVGKFLRMYDEPLFPFKSLSRVAEDVGLIGITSVTGEQFVEAKGIGKKWANEVIQASTRVNYGQNIPLIHGLETMVCMATSGAMAISGGNWKMFAHMLKASATTLLNTTVEKISKQPNGTYAVTTSSGGTSLFDTVILAAPLQFSKLIIDPAPKHVPDQIPYVKLHVTLFASPHKLDPVFFKLPPGQLVPQVVLTTLPPNEYYGSDPDGVGSPGFFSISVVHAGLNPNSTPKNRPEYIYKIFSPKPVDSIFLSNILGTDVSEEEESENGPVSWIYHKIWHSYPYEYPRVSFEEIKLDEGLFYTSGIESFISTMETSALMGKNVARLIVDEWKNGSTVLEIEEAAEAGKDVKMLVEGEQEFNSPNVREDQKPIRAKL